MIRKLTGTIDEIQERALVLTVQDIGYFIAVTCSTNRFTLGERCSLHTYLAVRETALDLYGFLTRDELEIFELLLTLPKVGPKSAQQILGQADITLLKNAVLQGDASYLSKMSGIGAKTAQKIVHELQDKFADRFALVSSDTTPTYEDPAGTSDVIDALIALGYPAADARSAVRAIPPEITTTSEAVRYALKNLG